MEVVGVQIQEVQEEVQIEEVEQVQEEVQIEEATQILRV